VKKRPSLDELLASYKTLYLQPSAPIVVVRAAHIALSKIYHPDKGGNPEAMKPINAARDSIQIEESYREARRAALAARYARTRIRRAHSRKHREAQ
jgi:hypothetical protein